MDLSSPNVLQFIAVFIVGLVLGAVARPYFVDRPIPFYLVASTLFFVTRSFLTEGNGILYGLALSVVYAISMLTGRYLVQRRYED